MLFLRFIAAVGALMGLYTAAALQIGPEQTDANVCKLLRRFSSAVPEQCISAVDDWGTVIAAIFVVACLTLALWDFRNHPVRVKCATALQRTRPHIQSVRAKVDPHFITIGLVIAVIGIAIAGYGVLKKPNTP